MPTTRWRFTILLESEIAAELYDRDEIAAVPKSAASDYDTGFSVPVVGPLQGDTGTECPSSWPTAER
jgi:hypothetical protein